MPSPLFAESFNTYRGIDPPRISIRRSMSMSRCGSRSVLVTTINAEAANMPEYFSACPRLSHDTMTTLWASPRSKPAGHTSCDIFDEQDPSGVPSRSWRRPDRVEMVTLAGLIWIAGTPVARMRSASVFLITFDHGKRILVADPPERFHQRAVLPNRGWRPVERKSLCGLQSAPVIPPRWHHSWREYPLDAQEACFAGGSTSPRVCWCEDACACSWCANAMGVPSGCVWLCSCQCAWSCHASWPWP